MERLHRLVTIAVLGGVLACGRIGYEERPLDVDAPVTDGPPGCPIGTVESCPGSTVCIEVVERGYVPWTTARDACVAAGRRLCADAEWAMACTCASGLVDMTDSEWEWVAEESGGVAQKRGYDACDAISSHPITDSYDYRCCADR